MELLELFWCDRRDHIHGHKLSKLQVYTKSPVIEGKREVRQVKLLHEKYRSLREGFEVLLVQWRETKRSEGHKIVLTVTSWNCENAEPLGLQHKVRRSILGESNKSFFLVVKQDVKDLWKQFHKDARLRVVSRGTKSVKPMKYLQRTHSRTGYSCLSQCKAIHSDRVSKRTLYKSYKKSESPWLIHFFFLFLHCPWSRSF